jgi:transaldolase
MMELSDFVRLLKYQNPHSEVWWDASPTVYAGFRKLLLSRYSQCTSYIEQLLPQLWRDTPGGVSGATTNPKLVARALLEHAHMNQHWVQALDPDLPAARRARQLYDRLIVEGARLLYPLWASSDRRVGWLSAQVDTTQLHSTELMVARGLELARLAPNVMVKVPGSQHGYSAIEQLVAHGCSVNNTLCFSVSQCAAAVAAIARGRLLARENQVDTRSAEYVVSFMIGRFGDEPQFDQQARRCGITLTQADKRWAELAVYQALQALLQRWQTPVRLLLCSLRVDTDEHDQAFSWHLERTGADTTVYTMTPDIIEFLVQRQASGKPVVPASGRWRIPEQVMSKLLCIPYFTDAYFENTLDAAAFEQQPAFITARNEACTAHGQLQAFVEGFARQELNATPMSGSLLKACLTGARP